VLVKIKAIIQDRMHGEYNVKLTDWFRITEVESVYCAVRTESL
jgi:hypothetical protein